MTDIAIRVTDLVKDFDIYGRPSDLALELITGRKRHTKFRALDGLNFDVPRGEVLGIIGSNGAGKSTLLKIVTGVLEPSSGSVEISGKVSAILELGIGFNPEYSGRDNIKLSGLLYGMSAAEIEQKTDSIIDFSGLAEFIDRPVKSYSSGMQSRLAFSVATAVDPEILIIDEALATGDSAFVQKCLRRIRQLCAGGRTVLLVSHGTGLLAQLCQRVIWLDRGKIRSMGRAIEIVQEYDLAAHQTADADTWIDKVEDSLPAASDAKRMEAMQATARGEHRNETGAPVASDRAQSVFRRGPVFIENVELLDHKAELTNRLVLLRPFTLKIHYRVEGDIPTASLGLALAINNANDLSPVAQVFTQNIRPYENRDTYALAQDRSRAHRRGTLVAKFDKAPFRKGGYFLSLGLLPNEPATWEFYEYRHFFYPFTVDDAGMDVGAPVLLAPQLSNLDRNAIDAVEASRAERSSSTQGEFKTIRDEIDKVCKIDGGYPQAWPRHTKCPACDQAALRGAFEKYGFQHDRCGNCGFVCVNPYPPDAVLDRLYSGSYYSRIRELFELPRLQNDGEGTPFSAPRRTLQGIIDRVAPIDRPGAWLDVGGGLGAFARLVGQVRPDWQVTLNERNPASVRIAETLLGLKVSTDDPSALLAAGKMFDVVSAIAVIEHIPDPLPFLMDYGRLLKPGGWLVFLVPHFTALNATASKRSSANVIPPFHTSLFSETAMKAMLSRLPGFDLVSVEQSGMAAFNLLEHVDYGDQWDVSIPTEQDPQPRSIQIEPYRADAAAALAVLADAAPKLASYFAKHDGMLDLAAYCRRL